jgi:hypothetical protein
MTSGSCAFRAHDGDRRRALLDHPDYVSSNQRRASRAAAHHHPFTYVAHLMRPPPARIIGGLTMRREKERSGQIDRRRLLKGAGLAIGAAGATSAVGAGSAAAVTDESKPPQQAGYRETELVKAYYRSARY